MANFNIVPVPKSKEHVINCRCGLMGVSSTNMRQSTPFVALLASVVEFLVKASQFFAVFDISVPDKTRVVA